MHFEQGSAQTSTFNDLNLMTNTLFSYTCALTTTNFIIIFTHSKPSEFMDYLFTCWRLTFIMYGLPYLLCRI